MYLSATAMYRLPFILLGVPLLRGLQSEYSGSNGHFNLYTRKYLANRK